MEPAPTFCVTCENVHPDTAGKPPYQWRCMKAPAPPFGGFVDPDYRPSPPYHLCKQINDGACEDWQPKREAKAHD